MPLVFRGGTGITTAGQTSLALPTGTQLDDYVVIGGVGNNTVTDARFTEVHNPSSSPPSDDGPRVWTGSATTLADITLTGGTHNFQGVACVTFEPVSLGGTVTGQGNDGTVEVPSVPGTAAICVIMGSAPTPAGLVEPPEYLTGVSSGTFNGENQVRIDYWNSTGPGESPAGTMNAGPLHDWWVWVQGALVSSRAPSARKYPRSDGGGFGSGRIFPPASTQQAGRLNGPY